jgi:PAS domain S-box-containing protein
MTETGDPLFRSFSDAMPLGVCLVNVQAKILYWNAAAEWITGYLGPEVLGRTYRGDLLIHCADSSAGAEVQCPVLEVLRDGRAVVADLFLRHKDGHRVSVHVCAFPLRDSMGEMRGVGEILDASQGKQELIGWAGHSEREFEMATGLPAVEESREHLQTLLHSRAASSSALIVISMSERHAILQHRGAAMLHHAIRVLAKTVAGLVPARSYIGCWSDWRLVVIIPECNLDMLEGVKSKLAGVGSSCAVKWWGDRVVLGIRAAARYLDSSQTVDALIQGLEPDLISTTNGEE